MNDCILFGEKLYIVDSLSNGVATFGEVDPCPDFHIPRVAHMARKRTTGICANGVLRGQIHASISHIGKSRRILSSQ